MAARGKYQRKTHTLKCEWCGEKFESKTFWAKYCSDAHEQKAYRKRVQEQQLRDRERQAEQR